MQTSLERLAEIIFVLNRVDRFEGRIFKVLAGERHGGSEPPPEAYRKASRDIARWAGMSEPELTLAVLTSEGRKRIVVRLEQAAEDLIENC